MTFTFHYSVYIVGKKNTPSAGCVCIKDFSSEVVQKDYITCFNIPFGNPFTLCG